MMSFKKYLLLMWHVLVTAVIILSLPLFWCVVLSSWAHPAIVIVMSLLSSVFSIYLGLQYVHRTVTKKDLF